MTAHYEPDEMSDIRGRRRARLLIPLGAVLMAAGLAGGVLATVLKVAWLGLFGGPAGVLSWLAVLVGAGCLVAGGLSLADAVRRNRT